MSQIVPVQSVQGEARADSRDLAERLGNKHKNVLSLIDDYADEFAPFGAVAFETEVRPAQQKSGGGGIPARYALLNEDQCYFLLTLVRNNDTTVTMKRELVQAFGAFRRQVAAPAALPTDPIELLSLSLQGLQLHKAQIAELQVATAQLHTRLNDTPIAHHPTEEAMIHALCQELGKIMPGSFPAAYRAFKAHFGVAGVPLAKYSSLPVHRYEEACGYLRGLIAQHSRGRLLDREA